MESQIRDALVNLVFNAVDAMPNGGTLTIRTRGDGRGRNRIVIEVSDSGVGMDEDTRRRCLEPFFTTKGERGTGLGLAMVYGVAERHGANLDIESEPGSGTTVRLSFAAMVEHAPRPYRRPAVNRWAGRSAFSSSTTIRCCCTRCAMRSRPMATKWCPPAAGRRASTLLSKLTPRAGRSRWSSPTWACRMSTGARWQSTIKTSVPATLVLMLTGWGRRLVAEGDIPPGVDEILSKPPKLIDLRNALATTSGTGD